MMMLRCVSLECWESTVGHEKNDLVRRRQMCIEQNCKQAAKLSLLRSCGDSFLDVYVICVS